MTELFHFDIETCGEYPDLETFKQMDSKGSELFESKFHRMKWNEKYSCVEEAYIENAGIISTFGKICCISFGYLDNDGSKQIRSYYGDDELDIITSFNDLLKRIELKDFSLCGYRIFHYDIPWILHKLHKYRIKPANIINIYGKKPWDMRVVDLSEDWKGKFAWPYSFDEVCYELGVVSPKDEMDGSLVHQFFHAGKIEDIKTYCEKDINASIDVSIKMYKEL
jgi:predicted PolB exonuclease-like 3'-5' exonuclease